jgi:hypothetical protein
MFASRTFDVRSECRAWIRNRAGEGYLWGYQPASAAAQPADSRELCFVEDAHGRVVARVVEASGLRPATTQQQARGAEACSSLLRGGWIEQPLARDRHP